MTIPRCETCKQLVFRGHHRCPPEWVIVEPEVDGEHFLDPNEEFDPTDYRIVRARDAEEAAEECIEQSDDECYVLRGNPATVYVKPMSNLAAPWRVFVVEGETVARYSAVEKKEDDNES